MADEWTTADTLREAAFLTIDAIDWAQTRNIARDPQHYYESNHSLGDHPSIRQVDRYFVLATLGHVAISKLLPRDWREGFQYVSIGIEAEWVNHNYRVGISTKF